MRSGLIGALVSGLLSAVAIVPATAQPPVPAYSWTGFYVGGNVGQGFGDSDVASNFSCVSAINDCVYASTQNAAMFSSAGTGTLSQTRYHGGIQGGFNWQVRNVVMGVEVDYSAFRLRKTQTGAAPLTTGEGGNNFSLTTGVESKWLATVRGRLGWTIVPTVLLYATTGLAVTDLTVSNAFEDDASSIIGITANTIGSSSATQRKLGWTIGGGAEWALLGNWTLKAEYLYFNFGSVNTAAEVTNPSLVFDPNRLATWANLRARIARVGLNFRF
jgi:outer membrane immunogenic protein